MGIDNNIKQQQPLQEMPTWTALQIWATFLFQIDGMMQPQDVPQIIPFPLKLWDFLHLKKKN